MIRDKTFSVGPAYTALEKIGEGSFGSVYRVIHQETQKEYAIKVMKEQYITEGIPSHALREISLLKKLSHPHIIKLNQFALGKNHIEICLDYCKYDLYSFKHHYFNKNPSIYNDLTIKKIIFQLLQGVNYLHSNLIMHRDLKPQNVLINYINGEPIVKVTDFGSSRKFTIPYKAYTKEISTLYYKAPELLLGQTAYSIAIDMWSIGCICVELIINDLLFNGKSDLELLESQFKLLGTLNEKTFPGVSSLPYYNPNFKEYKPYGLRRVIEENSTFAMSDLFFDLIEQMLLVDPSKRITCKDALMHEYFNGIVRKF